MDISVQKLCKIKSLQAISMEAMGVQGYSWILEITEEQKIHPLFRGYFFFTPVWRCFPIRVRFTVATNEKRGKTGQTCYPWQELLNLAQFRSAIHISHVTLPLGGGEQRLTYLWTSSLLCQGDPQNGETHMPKLGVSHISLTNKISCAHFLSEWKIEWCLLPVPASYEQAA